MARSGITFVQRLAAKWQSSDIGSLGAAMAYFALFSIFPLLLIILSIVGFVVDPADLDLQAWLLGAIESPQLRAVIDQTLSNLRASRGQAGIIGFVILLFAASGVFGALDRSMSVIWEVSPPQQQGSVLAGVWQAVKSKLLAFALVLGCALLLLLSVASTIAISSLSRYTDWLATSGLIWQVVQFVVALALLALGFTLVFKLLPNTAVAWHEALVGGVSTALLLTLLQKLIGIYLGQADYTSYGAVGGLMAMMVYFFLTCQIILLGAACSAVYARLTRQPDAAAASEASGGAQGRQNREAL